MTLEARGSDSSSSIVIVFGVGEPSLPFVAAMGALKYGVVGKKNPATPKRAVPPILIQWHGATTGKHGCKNETTSTTTRAWIMTKMVRMATTLAAPTKIPLWPITTVRSYQKECYHRSILF
jgi:hypothetical protein